MPISLLPAEAVEADAIRNLAVDESQTDFIASNDESLEELAERPECVGFAVMAEGQPVGFAMYALDADDGNHWIYRLMIDISHQGKGFGGQALAALIETMATIPGCDAIYLGVYPDNTRAHALYQRFGFRETGKMIGGETVLRLDLAGNKA
ncbi:GNAT family N-acetyltransferase [Ensifer sp. HO-A22]|uniref:GNAT family N-acetyltransferase n=1 Tax=Ensifer oleiphilus TaxID=2742698 RepID=A0A7Y6Q4R8_9HYPH|nr:GNAT family N-acetyltransferase [Ensifer oleiphilus]NVD39038.1 GNAT family N-acetyltransferase [Ensifer oleiphilus]